MIGQTISHYKILEKLGEGGMGVVYKAEDTKLKRTVALKFLPRGLEAHELERTRFLQETQAASALNHPNVCTIYDIKEESEHHFIVMEYVDGETLKSSIVNRHLSFGNCIDIAIQIGEGLNAAHKKNIIHRDIKPDNIMLTDEGMVKIMDYGLAKLRGASKLTKTHSTLGTLCYMSPEQARGEDVDQRSDIFSLGAVLYEMITGRRPFKGEHEAAIMYSLMNETPEPLARYKSRVPDELQRIIDKALYKERSGRYQHVDEMVADLRRVQYTISGGVQSKTKISKLIWVAAALMIVVIAVGIYIFYPKSIPVSSDRKSIAVLPFKNLSSSKEDEYFSDGIAEDIRTQLSKIADLKVISQQGVLRYKNSDKSITEIGKELGVATVLEGSVQHAGNQVRINAQLIDANDESHIWADKYDKEMAQIFSVQSEVAQKIAEMLRAKLLPSEIVRIEKKPTENTEAYQLYLKGRYFINKTNKADAAKGISYFEQAIAIDSNYAKAYAGMAEGYDHLWSWGGMPTKDAFPLMKGYAVKAISIDENLAEPYAILADISCAEWNWDTAEENYLRAIKLDQNYVTARAWYAWYLTMMKRNDEALMEAKKAVNIDPLGAVPKAILGLAYMFRHQFDSAITQINEALSIDSTVNQALAFLGDYYWWKGNFKEAIEPYQKTVSLGDPTDIPLVAYCYARSGDLIKARHILSDPKTKDMVSAFYSLAFMSIGEMDRGFEYLEKSYDEHDQTLLVMISIPRGIDSQLDSLREDPRFHALVKKMGLEEIYHAG